MAASAVANATKDACCEHDVGELVGIVSDAVIGPTVALPTYCCGHHEPIVESECFDHAKPYVYP